MDNQTNFYAPVQPEGMVPPRPQIDIAAGKKSAGKICFLSLGFFTITVMLLELCIISLIWIPGEVKLGFIKIIISVIVYLVAVFLLAAFVLKIISKVKGRECACATVPVWVCISFIVVTVLSVAVSQIVHSYVLKDSPSGRYGLIRFAEENYGECKYIREEGVGGLSRTVYLRDIESGIEYSVTSGMESEYADVSSEHSYEVISSDFDEVYIRHVMDLSRDEINELMKDNGLKYSSSDEYITANTHVYMNLMSDDYIDEEPAKKLADDICLIIKKNDCKDLLEIKCGIVAGDSQNTWTATRSRQRTED